MVFDVTEQNGPCADSAQNITLVYDTDRLVEIVIDDMLLVEREHNLKPKDLLSFYKKRIAYNRKGGRYDETRRIVSKG